MPASVATKQTCKTMLSHPTGTVTTFASAITLSPVEETAGSSSLTVRLNAKA